MIHNDTDAGASLAAVANGADVQLVTLSGNHSLRTAATLRASLLQALEGSGPLAIDLSGIEEADIGTLQVLVAAERSARAAGRPIRFIAGPETAVGKLLVASGIRPVGGDMEGVAGGWTFEQGIAA